jgi:exodeoxyribonuclease V alpha subunit
MQKFGDRLFVIIENDPMQLTAIRGITPEKAGKIHEEWEKIQGDQSHDLFFASTGITIALRNRLVDHYGDKQAAVDAIKDNPYELADEVWGIGFKKADAIALRAGVGKEAPFRIKAGVRWILQEAAGKGHTFLPLADLTQQAVETLQASADIVRTAIQAAIADGHLVDNSQGEIYGSDLHQAEALVAKRLRALAAAHHDEMMHELTHSDLAEMDEDQQRALTLALRSKILVMTGGPGVGKSWTINRIIQALGNRAIELAAPTGKAAKRIVELSGRPARTIHRLLEFNPFIGGFARDADNPIDADTIIIDETSMLDIRLMASLMVAVSDKSQLILVGDVDQLPSVGPGRVLADMIESGAIPCARLKTLHRQAAESYINLNAQRINAGQKLMIDNARPDFVFLQADEAAAIPDLIVKAILRASKHFGYRHEDIQVLCPQKRSAIGTKELNDKLRPVLNPDGAKLTGTPFLVHDRVIQTRNNYKLGIFNGDIGKITAVDQDYLYVEFDGVQGANEVKYPLSDIGDLQLAYALTIHKFQGSETPAVIIPVHTCNYIMLQRTLLYTGVTRGKKLVVLVGSQKAVNLAIRTVDSTKRYSNLGKLLREAP